MQMPVEALLGLYSSVGFGELSGLNLVGEVTGIFLVVRVGHQLKERPFLSGMVFPLHQFSLLTRTRRWVILVNTSRYIL